MYLGKGEGFTIDNRVVEGVYDQCGPGSQLMLRRTEGTSSPLDGRDESIWACPIIVLICTWEWPQPNTTRSSKLRHHELIDSFQSRLALLPELFQPIHVLCSRGIGVVEDGRILVVM